MVVQAAERKRRKSLKEGNDANQLSVEFKVPSQVPKEAILNWISRWPLQAVRLASEIH